MSADITNLDLSHIEVGDNAARALSSATHLSTLKVLTLHNNRISDSGASAISDAKHLSTLQSLGLRFNRIGNGGAKALAEAKHLRSLQLLDLGHNNIGDYGVQALAEAPHLSSLTALHLNDNMIGDNGIRALSEASHLRSLQFLDLGHNKIGNDGIRALAEAPHLSSLTALHLSHNEIGDSGIRSLSEALHLRSLQSLHLSYNRISDEGAMAMAEASHLRSLLILRLRHNEEIGDDGARAVILKLPNLHQASFASCKLNAPESLHGQVDGLRRFYAVSAVAETVPDPYRQSMLIGEPMAGKTTLFKRLMHEKVTLGSESRTQGIVRGEYLVKKVTNLSINATLDMTIDLWDLGGHTLQHMCHALFFRKDALYLLVIDDEVGDANLEQWLDLIEQQSDVASSSRTSILPIWNAKSGPAQVPDLQRFRENHRYLKHFDFKDAVSVELANNDPAVGLRELTSWFQSHLRHHPVSSYWAVIDEIVPLIETIRGNAVEPRTTFEQSLKKLPVFQEHYRTIREALVEQDGKALSVGQFVGTVLAVLDQRRAITLVDDLDLVIHDPLWVEKGIYALLPPEDTADDTRPAYRSLVKRMRKRTPPYQLPGLFTLPDIGAYLEELGIESHDHRDLVKILQRRELGLIIRLSTSPSQNPLYCVPAYLEELDKSEHDPIREITQGRDTARYCEIFERESWPPYFIYRHMVWVAGAGDGSYRVASYQLSDPATRLTLHESSMAPGCYKLSIAGDQDFQLELIMNRKRLWVFWHAPDDTRPVSRVINDLHATCLDLLGHLVNPSRATLNRLLPCPICLSAVTDSLESVGFFDYNELVNSSDEDELLCSLENPHQQSAKAIRTYLKTLRQNESSSVDAATYASASFTRDQMNRCMDPLAVTGRFDDRSSDTDRITNNRIIEREKKEQLYISYARDDKDRNNALVDRFCLYAKSQNLHMLRDEEQLVLGDSISSFMNELAEGERIYVFLSEAYLKSIFCMTELHGIWAKCQADEETFAHRVRVHIDSELSPQDTVEMNKVCEYWEERLQSFKNTRLWDRSERKRADAVQIKQFADDAYDILSVIYDRVQFRDEQTLFNDITRED